MAEVSQGIESLNELERKIIEDIKLGNDVDLSKNSNKKLDGGFIKKICVDYYGNFTKISKGLSLECAEITGDIDFDDLKISVPIKFKKCKFDSRVSLRFSELKRLTFDDCDLKQGMEADSCLVHEMVSIINCTSSAAIAFTAAKLMDRLILDGTKIIIQKNNDETHSGGPKKLTSDDSKKSSLNDLYSYESIKASGIRVENGIFFGKNFLANGVINLSQCHVDGNIEFSGVTISSSMSDQHCAIDISGSRVNGYLFLRDGSKIEGSVDIYLSQFKLIDLRGVDIGLSGSEDISKRSLDAECIHVEGNFTIGKNLTIKNGINLKSSKINGGLFFGYSEFCDHNLAEDNISISGEVDFTHCKMSRILIGLDEWKRNCKQKLMEPMLNGSEYDSISFSVIKGKASVSDMKNWLESSRDKERDLRSGNGRNIFYHQPYEQLANILRKIGHENDARIILKEKMKLAHNSLNNELKWGVEKFFGVLKNYALRLIGYGYDAKPAIYTSIGLMLSFCLVFHVAYYFEYMAISKEIVYISEKNSNAKILSNIRKEQAFYQVVGFFLPQSFKEFPKTNGENESSMSWPPGEYTNFNALAYSIDVFLPLVNLHQEEAWLPMVYDGFWGTLIGSVIWLALWLEILAGWILSTLIVASLTGIIKKD